MHVAGLWRYPVKSMRGESLDSVRFELGGIPFDRRVTVMDSDPRRPGKPLTATRKPRLLAYRSFVRSGRIVVGTPSGAEHAASDRAWLDELEQDLEQQATVLFADAPVHDDSDILVINRASLNALSEEYGKRVDPQRFRPNVILDGADAKPFEENSWPGDRFAIGSAVLAAVHPCERCVITTIDPDTIELDLSFLKLLFDKHDARFGTYCRVVQAGTVSVGDLWSPVSAFAVAKSATHEGDC